MHECTAEVYADEHGITVSKVDSHIWGMRSKAEKGDLTVPFAQVTQRTVNGVPLTLTVFNSYAEYLKKQKESSGGG